jgi:hypothetical protein
MRRPVARRPVGAAVDARPLAVINASYVERGPPGWGNPGWPSRLANMPYVICSHCHVTSYVSLSYLQRSEPCPACDTPLGERATPVAPALALALTAADGRGSGRASRPAAHRAAP